MVPTSGEINEDMNVEIDNEVSLLVPHYDEDTNVVFLCGKVCSLIIKETTKKCLIDKFVKKFDLCSILY